MKKILVAIIFALLFDIAIYAQVGVNTVTPKALLDIRAENPANPESSVGFLVPSVDAVSATNPGAAQHSMLIYLDNQTRIMNDHLYFWDNKNLRWDWFKDIVTSEIDFNTTIASGDRFYTSAGVVSALTTPANGARFIRFNNVNAAIADERNTIDSNGRLRIGVKGEYQIVLTGGIVKTHTGITDYRSDVLVNGSVSSPLAASQINIPNIANRAGVFSTSQVLSLNVGDLLSVQATTITTGLTNPSATVNSPFTLVITLLREL